MTKSRKKTNKSSEPPDNAVKFFLGAKSALKIGDMGSAERLLRRSLDLSPKNYLYMLSLARLLVQMDKNFDEAEALLLDTIKLNLQAVEPRLILSALYEKQSRTRSTQSILKSVVNLDPTNFVARRKLSQLGIEIASDEEQLKLRAEILAECLVVNTADLPLITVSTAVVEQVDTEKAINKEDSVKAENKSNLEKPLSLEPVSNEVGLENINTTQLEGNKIDIEKTAVEENLQVVTTFTETKAHRKTTGALESSYIGLSERLAAADLFIQPEKPHLLETESSVNKVINKEIQNFLEENTPSHSQPLTVEAERSSSDTWSTDSEETVVEVLQVEASYLIVIVKDFFSEVKNLLGEDNAFLLLNRSKQQIESLYPELDYFEIYEDRRIIGFVGQGKFVGKRTMESIATWMYLYMILLKETSHLRDEAREKVLKKALPKRDDVLEEKLFRRYFNEIQL